MLLQSDEYINAIRHNPPRGLPEKTARKERDCAHVQLPGFFSAARREEVV